MKYLIAVDSSDNSRYAFSQAKKRFFTTKDHVYILTVTESPTAYPFEDLLNFSSESYTEMNRKIEQMYAELLKKFGRKLTRASIPHTCLLARGTIKDVICRQAQDLCVDVVIMGRRGLGTLERTFMGSTSQYCVHNLNCSVLVIPFIQEENLTTKTEEELASELKSKEREEISGNIKCFDPNCHNEECLQHGRKFQKIGQYEREKWQAPEERLSEPKQQNVPIKSKGKKSKKNKNNKGNVGKSVGKWEDVTKESKEKGIEKEEFAQVDPAIIEKEKAKRKGKITGELLKEQKTKLKHEEGTIEVTEEETEIEYLPKEELEKEKAKRKGKITGELLKQQKTKLKHEEGTVDVIEEDKEGKEFSKSKETFASKAASKDVPVKETTTKSKKKKNNKRKNNKGKVAEEQQKGKWEEKSKVENLPECLPKEAFPHVESAEPITGELLEQQKTKLKHEEGSIDVIEEDKEGKEFSKSKEDSSKKNVSKESGGKWVEKGKGKEETKVEAKEGASKKEAVFQEVTSKKKKNRKRRNRNKGKSPEEKGKVEEKKFENLPECLPKEAFPHFVAAKPITGELLSQQKKKLKHEKGTIDVTGEEKKEFLKSKESGGKVQAKGKGKGKGKEEFSESKEEFKKESGVKETPKESLPTAQSKNKKRNRNNKNKGKANVKETNVKGSNVKDEKDLPECLPKEEFPHFESAKPITGDLLSQQKKKLKHEKGTIDVTGEEKKEFLSKSKESGGKVQAKGKGKGKEKEEFSEVKLKEETEIEYLPKEELEKEKAKRKGKITGELLKKQKTKLKHEEGTVDVTGEEKKEFLSKSKESGGKGKEEFKEETSSPITGKWKGKDISGRKPTSVSGSESPKIISKFESPKRSKLEEKECNDPLCNNPECPKHGTQVKEEVKKGPKWQGKVHEKKECNDPLCNNPHCVKHGKASKEKGEFIGSKGKESSSPSSASKEVPYSGKSFAEVVSQSSEEKSQSPKIIEKSEHKAAINIGEGKIEGKIGSKTDEEGAWKGSVEVGYKGKDEKGKEYEGKHYEASIQSK